MPQRDYATMLDGLDSQTCLAWTEKLANLWGKEAEALEGSSKRGDKGKRESLRAAMWQARETASTMRLAIDTMASAEPSSRAAEPAETPAAGEPESEPVNTLVPPVSETPPVALFVDPVDGGASSLPAVTVDYLAPPAPDTKPDHRSVSQVSEFSDCGMRYRLSRRDGVAQMPAWWFVGGTAIHASVESMVSAGSSLHLSTPLDSDAIQALWKDRLASAVAEAMRESTVPMDHWLAGGQGKETYTWWLYAGPEMLDRYQKWHIDMLNQGWRFGESEREFLLNVGETPVKGFIDQTWMKYDEGKVLIVDLKSGSSKQTDDFQLDVYAEAIRRLATTELEISGCYLDLRTGIASAPIEATPARWRLAEYRIKTMDEAERLGLYLPRPSHFCKSCGVRRACPIQTV